MNRPAARRPAATVPDMSPADIDGLRCWAAELWRLEPAATTSRLRTDLLLRLHGVRLDLEELDRRLSDGPVGAEDERALVLCAVRLDELAEHWTHEPMHEPHHDLNEPIEESNIGEFQCVS